MDIGFVFIVVSLVASAIAFISFARYIKQQDNSIYKFARITLVIETILITVAISILTYYFLIRDFNVEYVASYSDRNLPLTYTLSAIWGGASGSLLLWAWLLSLFMTGIAIRERKDRLTGYALSILLSVNMFFLLMLVFISNPFERLSFTPVDGNGLNPLLQNPGMLFHPPTLFVGYAGLTVPFAFALAGLLAGSELWVFRVRKWTLFSWLFVGLGIWFGGWWSYSVLGWGGYWAWDPVENSSLVPWLIATALLHSIMLQESRRGMKLWNILLSIGTFETVILGTFLTRSGIISSVHAFGEQGVGPVFTSYLLIMLVASLGILWHRIDQVKSMNVVTSATGKESSFLLNNLLFVLMALTVVWGTLFPMINEAVTHTKMSVGPGFYNVISPWVLTLLSILMGVCIILKWGTTSTEELIRKLKYPLTPAVAAIPAMYFMGIREPGALAGFAISAFVIAIHLEDYLIDAKDYAQKKGIGMLRSMGHLFLVRRRRYGGYIVHLSMIILLIGIVGTTFYKTTYSTTLKPGEPMEIGDYTFTYDNLSVSNITMGTEYKIDFLVKNGNSNEKFTAGMTHDAKLDSNVVNVGVLSSLYQDIYVIPEAVDNESVSVTVNYNPLISFVWYGFGVTVIGVVVGLLPKRLVGGEKLEQS